MDILQFNKKFPMENMQLKIQKLFPKYNFEDKDGFSLFNSFLKGKSKIRLDGSESIFESIYYILCLHTGTKSESMNPCLHEFASVRTNSGANTQVDPIFVPATSSYPVLDSHWQFKKNCIRRIAKVGHGPTFKKLHLQL